MNGQESGVLHLDADHPQFACILRQDRQQLLVARIEALHVADLHDLAGLVPRGRDLLGLGNGEAERFLAEHVRSARQRIQRDLRVILVGSGHENRVDAGVQQLLIAAKGRISAALQLPAHVGRCIGDADDLVELFQAAQVRNMLHLTDEPGADDTDFHPLRSFHPLPLRKVPKQLESPNHGVIPAEAGIHSHGRQGIGLTSAPSVSMDSGFAAGMTP